MAAMNESTCVRANPDPIWQELGEEIVILDISAGAYFGLDLVGSRVWRLIQSPTTVAQVRDALLAEFAVDRERCTRELHALLEALAARGLIRVEAA